MLSSISTEETSIQQEKDSVVAFITRIKHSLLLVRDEYTCVATNRSELVLKRINPSSSLAKEDFSQAKRKLFGSGFEQSLKLRSEKQQKRSERHQRLVNPFFVGRPPVVSHDRAEAVHGVHSKLLPNANKDEMVQSGKRIPRQKQSPRFQNPTSFNPKQI